MRLERWEVLEVFFFFSGISFRNRNAWDFSIFFQVPQKPTKRWWQCWVKFRIQVNWKPPQKWMVGRHALFFRNGPLFGEHGTFRRAILKNSSFLEDSTYSFSKTASIALLIPLQASKVPSFVCQKSHATLGTEVSQQKQGESEWLNLKLDVKRYAQRDAENIRQVFCRAWCPTGQKIVRVFVGFCLILPKSWLTIVEGDRTFISDCVCKERCLLHDES